jgi:hypothetical protein
MGEQQNDAAADECGADDAKERNRPGATLGASEFAKSPSQLLRRLGAQRLVVDEAGELRVKPGDVVSIAHPVS